MLLCVSVWLSLHIAAIGENILTSEFSFKPFYSSSTLPESGWRDESYSVALGAFIFNHSWWIVRHADDRINYDTEHQHNRSWMDYCFPLLYNPTFYFWKCFTPLYESHVSLSHIFPFSLWLIQQFYNSVLFAAHGFDWHIICRRFYLTTLRYFVILANTSTVQVLQSRSVFTSFYFFEVRAAWFFQGFIAFKELNWISTRVGLRKPELTGAGERSTYHCCQL